MVVGLLDQGRRDPPIGDEALQRQPRDLPADPVEARQQHGVRRLVDDHVDARQLLEDPDVAPVAADDPALHLIARELDEPRGGLARVARREALNGDREDAARPPLRLAPRLLLELDEAEARLAARLALDVGEQQVLRLARAEPGDALEHATLNPLRPLQLLRLELEIALAILEHLRTTLEVGLLDSERLPLAQRLLLHPRDLRAACLKLRVGSGRGIRLRALGLGGHRAGAPPPGPQRA